MPEFLAPPEHHDFYIRGVTLEGKPFRPSDWIERFCGIMACFKPAGMVASPMQFSPYVQPRQVGDEKVVVVDARLRQIEPLAHDFALNFARDNKLQTGRVADLSELNLAKA